MQRDFDICEFGAVPDGNSVNTDAVQRAVDACHEAGGGRVVCGPGTWITGSVELKSHVELHLAPGCRIVGSRRLADYTPLVADGFHTERGPEKSAHGLFWAANADNIAITGSGMIDGVGLAFYNDPGGTGKLDKPDTPRPRIGMFYQCCDVRIQDVSMTDCSCWTLWLMQCENVRISGIVIRGNRRMRNVDGIDVDACRDVTISDCRMDTEDDCIAVRAMQQLYDTPAVCENVVVTNCVLRSNCQGVRVGCPNDGIIRDCTFSNLVIDSGSNGILFENPKRYLDPEGETTADISDILFSNILVRSRFSGIKLVIEDGIPLRRLARVSFSDMRVRCNEPCVIQGNADTAIRDVRFDNVKIDTSSDDALICRHCEGVRFTNVDLSTGIAVS